jgi:hypothetical protein
MVWSIWRCFSNAARISGTVVAGLDAMRSTTLWIV